MRVGGTSTGPPESSHRGSILSVLPEFWRHTSGFLCRKMTNHVWRRSFGRVYLIGFPRYIVCIAARGDVSYFAEVVKSDKATARLPYAAIIPAKITWGPISPRFFVLPHQSTTEAQPASPPRKRADPSLSRQPTKPVCLITLSYILREGRSATAT